MSDRELYDVLISMDKVDLLSTISIMIEFYSHTYETDFNRVIKHLKNTHKYLLKNNN